MRTHASVQPVRHLVQPAQDGAPSITDWISAGSTAATLVIATIAAGIALFQLIQARRLELDKSQPYVMTTMEESVSPEFIDLVIRNYGQTAAFDVRVEISPKPKRTQADAEEVRLPEVIPVMAPGQEWRTHWDSARNRYSSDLPDRHQAVITYSGDKAVYKQSMASTAVLDWSIYKSRVRMVKYGVHDLTKAVRGLRKNQEKWTEDAQGMSVWLRSGADKDERERRDRQEHLRAMETDRAAAPPPRRRATRRKEPLVEDFE